MVRDAKGGESPPNLPLLHGSLFSGVGGFEIAAHWAGWDTVFTSELNPYLRKVLKYYWPEAEHYGDIRKHRFTKHQGRIDVLTGGFPCFVSGTKVMTESGYKPIEFVSLGEKVLTKEGNFQEVNAVMRKESAPLVGIKIQGMHEELRCTPEHPFLLKKRVFPCARKRLDRFSDPDWVDAKDIRKGDLVGYRTFQGTLEYRTEDFWFLVGRYLGDGWCINVPRKPRKNSKTWKVIISSSKEEDLSDHITKAGYHFCKSEERDTYKWIITSRELCEFLMSFGKYAHGKFLNPICFKLTDSRKKALFDGWMSADGFRSGTMRRGCSVSEELIYGMAAIARDAYKVIPSITKIVRPKKHWIEGREVNQRDFFTLSISDLNKYSLYKDGVIWGLVKSVSVGGQKTVFNLGVNESETYTAGGVIVHNCQPFSVAGARRGAQDDRYLWGEMFRVIQEVAPRWVVAENVRGLISQEKGMVFEKVQADLESEGYEIFPAVLPACAVGAPHRRDRIWIIAHSGKTPQAQRSPEARWMETEDVNPGPGRIRSVTYPGSELLEGGSHEEGQETAEGHDSLRHPRDGRYTWEDFPSEPPIYRADDGVPKGVDDLSPRQWYRLTLTAYGNAIVPQVAFQIFEAINQYENLKN